MSIQPLITFKAGKCEADFDVSPPKVRPEAQPGYLYLYGEDDLIHFCWRGRDASLQDPDLDLVMVPTDGTFVPYTDKTSSTPKSPVRGRVFVLKFSSSSTRHFFWLQSAPQPADKPSHFSQRDLKIGELVNGLLQGLDIEAAQAEVDNIRDARDDDDDDDEDEVMEDAPRGHRGSASGGAGANATGGDVREEGEGSRGGGADGARARAAQASGPAQVENANQTIQNFLNSIRSGDSGGSAAQAAGDDQYTTIADLLAPSITTAALTSGGISDETVDELLSKHLPPALVYLAHGMDPSDIPESDDPDAVESLVEALEPHQKKDILRRVFQSPQFHQACMSVTSALRGGGLPGVADALKLEVEQDGYFNRGSGIPLSGGKAVEAFVQGILKEAKRKQGN